MPEKSVEKQSHGFEVAVEVRELSHAYGSRQALANVHLTVTRGEMFGILGPNGSGKSTLFKILATLLRPTSGGASVCGHDVLAEPEGVRKALGVVFQASSLDGKLTLEENLIHHGYFYAMSGKPLRKRVEEVIERMGLRDRRKDRVEHLSGGLRRRGDLAKCLIHEPRVLLLDEPTVGLDPGARREFWDYVVEIRAERHLTTLLTTHLMDEADRCDHLALLHRGEVVAYASPDELKRETGYDVIAVQSPEPELLAEGIRDRFHLNVHVADGIVRMQVVDGHRLIASLVQHFGSLIESVNLGKPTIEDVFLLKTESAVRRRQSANSGKPEPGNP